VNCRPVPRNMEIVSLSDLYILYKCGVVGLYVRGVSSSISAENEQKVERLIPGKYIGKGI
jgi:hypothetical protein